MVEKNKWYTFKWYISNLLSWYWTDIENFYFEDSKTIWIKDIDSYSWSFTCRFFYWIYDVEKKKWWIKYHWLSIDEFYIEIWKLANWFYDCKIWNEKWIYSGFKERIKWDEVKKLNFKNKSEYLNDTKDLYYKLIRLWITKNLIKYIIPHAWHDWRWNISTKELFFSQLKLLKNTIIDEDKKKLQFHPTHNVNRWYYEEYWYIPEEKYKKEYNKMLDYLWKENKVFFYSKDYSLREKLIKITNIKERKKIIEKEYKKLFSK